MGLLELPDLTHTLVDIGTTLLRISGYISIPGRTLSINLIHKTARQSELAKECIMQLCQVLFHAKYQAK